MKYKKQHFIPQSYLEAWCDPTTPEKQKPYIWLIPKNGGPGHSKAPQNVFKETDTYTIKLPDGSRNLKIEYGLAGIETQFSKLRRNKLLDNKELSFDEHIIVCALTVAMHARTPKQRNHIGGIFKKLKSRTNEVQKKLRDEETQVRVKLISQTHYISSGGPVFQYDEIKEISENPIQNTIFPTLQAEIPLLLKMDYVILTTESVPGFITSDAPCVWFDPEAYKRPFPLNNPGVGYPTIEITLPISPSQLLLFNSAGARGYIGITEAILNELNRRTRANANEFFVVSRNQVKQIWYEKGSPPDEN